jgi:hypothetical protein
MSLPKLKITIKPDVLQYVELKDFPGYQINRYGTVKGKLVNYLKPTPDERGYLRLRIVNSDGHKCSPRVHRLVAETFIPNVDGKEQVAHLDGNLLNNHVSNLKWSTLTENMADGQSKPKNNTSGYKNVYFRGSRNKWVAKIQRTTGDITLGSFKTPEEANEKVVEWERNHRRNPDPHM